MKLFETFRKFHVFVFRYRATNENAELEENKIRVIFDWENLWKGIRVSLGIILRLFYQWRKEIMVLRRFRRFPKFRGIDLANFLQHIKNKLLKLCNWFCKENFTIKLVFNPFKVKHCFSYKDPIPDHLKYFLVYKFTFAGCSSSFIGKTCRYFKTRIEEHIKKDIKSYIFRHLHHHNMLWLV